MSVFYPDARVMLQVVFEEFGAPHGRPQVFPVRAQQISIFGNSYKEADTFSVEFVSDDFPFSPDLIAAGTAEIYLFNKSGIQATPENITKKDDPELFLSGGILEPSIVGLWDDADLEYNEDSRIFSLTGRDYTALFLDKQFVTTPDKNGKAKPRRVAVGRSLKDTMQQLIDDVPGAAVMRLRADDDTANIKVGSGDGRTNRRGITVPANSNYWEAMTTLALRYGFILFVQSLDVVLTRPHVYIAGRSEITKLAWGKNLSSLKLSRKLGKERVPVIEVRSYNEDSRKVVIGRYPIKGTKAVEGVGTERDQVRVFTVPNISNAKQLRDIARMTYNQLARAEMTADFETRDLQDLEGQDVLRIRTGDAVGIQFDQFNRELLRELDINARVQLMVNKGYSREVASVVAFNYEKLESLRQPLRVRESTIDYDVDDGITISMEAQQFVNVSQSEEAA